MGDIQSLLPPVALLTLDRGGDVYVDVIINKPYKQYDVEGGKNV